MNDINVGVLMVVHASLTGKDCPVLMLLYLPPYCAAFPSAPRIFFIINNKSDL